MFRKSKYSFLLKNNLVWHSLLGISIKVSDSLYTQLSRDCCFNENTNSEVTKLIKHKFISTEETDEDLLRKIKSQIADCGYNNLFLIMTNCCNLACKYCFYQNTNHLQYTKMSFQTAQKAIDIFVSQRNKNEDSLDWFSQITFYGGEPLLNFECIKRVTDYIEQLKLENKLSKKTQLVINTNGTLIDDSVINWAKQYNIQVQISIDGNKIQHDKNRITQTGKGSYTKTIQGLKKLTENKIDVLPLITVTEDNLPQLPDIVYMLCKKYNLKHYGMNLLIDLGKNSITNYPEYAAEKMVETNQKTSIFSASDDAIDMLFDTLKNFKVVKQSCGVSRKMTVFSDGKIFSCQAISDCDRGLIGNVNQGLFSVKNIEYWKYYTRFNNTECLKCKYIGFCGGGCVASALFRHHKLGHIDIHYCRWIKHIMSEYFNPEEYLVEDCDANS